MIAALVKLLPFLQLILEFIKPGDGEKLTRAGKITTLAFVMLLLYAIFVTYTYVDQFHSFIEARERHRFVAQTLDEKNLAYNKLAEELKETREQLYQCLKRPYEGPVLPPTVAAPKPESGSPPRRNNDALRKEILNKINGER